MAWTFGRKIFIHLTRAIKKISQILLSYLERGILNSPKEIPHLSASIPSSFWFLKNLRTGYPFIVPSGNIEIEMNGRLLILHSIIAIMILLFFIIVLCSSLLLTMMFLRWNQGAFSLTLLVAAALISSLLTFIFSVKVVSSLYDNLYRLLSVKQFSEHS